MKPNTRTFEVRIRHTQILDGLVEVRAKSQEEAERLAEREWVKGNVLTTLEGNSFEVVDCEEMRG